MSKLDSLTVRQKFILNSVIEKGPLTIKDLSQQIEISERTILREASAINEWMKLYEVRIFESGGNLYISGKGKNLQRIRELLGGIPHLWMLTQEQRQVLITAQLLLAREPVKSAYFSIQFNVVEGTIIFYLDKIESWLKVKNLSMIRKRGYGLVVEGSDWNKRNAFVELLYNYKPIGELLAFLYDNNSDYLLSAFFKVTFGDDLINLIKGILKKFEGSSILKQNDIGYFGAFLHMLLAVERTRSGMPIELPEHVIRDIQSSEEFLFISDINEIMKKSGIELPDSELVYLAIHLNGDRFIYTDDGESQKLGFDMEDSVREIVYIVSKRLNTKIDCDSQLAAGLIQHINPALYRLTLGLNVRNPIINEIREYYPDLYNAADYACRLVFSKYNITIPSNEVGYITMHIGAAMERQLVFENKLDALVICSNGMSTAKILCSKLKNNFPELGRVEVCSLRDMKEKINNGYDIILSTIDVSKKLYDNIVVVSPFLSKGDIDAIKEHIKSKTGEKGNFSKLLLPYNESADDGMNDDFEMANNILKNFHLGNIDANNVQGVIKSIVGEMYGLGIIKNRETIESLIIKREELGNVVVPGSHMALIHVRADEIDVPFVGVFRLNNFINMESVNFSKENVDAFLVMLARRDESSFLLELLGRISISMVEEMKFTEILRLGDITDIRNVLVEILSREEY